MLVGALFTPAMAQEQSESQEKASLHEAEQSPGGTEDDWPWRFNVNIYAWAPKAPARIKANGKTVASEPETLGNILSSLEMAAMFELGLHKGPIGIFVSPVYYEGDYDANSKGSLGQKRKGSLSEDVWLIKYGMSYDFGPWHFVNKFNSPSVVFQPYVGGLYFHDDIDLYIKADAIDQRDDFRTTIEFNSPLVGMNTLFDLTKDWSLCLGFNFGGWDVQNLRSTHEFISTVAYHFTMFDVPSNVFAGYRYLHLDYKKSSVALHVDVKGPMIGIGWEF
jgi:hypothetical protein